MIMPEEGMCFGLDYHCPFPVKKRTPEHCLTCTQVLINQYHVKNYALTTIQAIKTVFEDTHNRDNPLKLSDVI